MNIVQMEYVTALVQLGSYAAAAESLCKTPQAVSKAICDLERELQIELFTRKNGKVVPTQFGELLAMRAEAILDDFMDITTFAQNPVFYPRSAEASTGKNERTITVALAETTPRGFPLSNLLSPEIFSFVAEGKMQIINNPSGACLSALEEGVIDAAIILGRVQKPGLRCTKLFTITPVLLLSNKHPLSKINTVSATDLKAYPIAFPLDLRYCYKVITRFVEAHGFSPSYENIAPLITEHQDFLDNRNGIIFVTEDNRLKDLYSNVVFKQLQGSNRLQIPICFVTRENQSHATINLLELALTKATAPSLRGLR